MKIIISESQYNLLFESLKLKDEDIQEIKRRGIFKFADSKGLKPELCIKKYGLTLDSKLFEELSGMNHEKGVELIHYYMYNKFNKVYDFEPKTFYCTHYINPKTFYNVVEEAIMEFLYNNYYAGELDEEGYIFDDLNWVIGQYVGHKYGEKIKNTYIKNCGENENNNN